MIKILFLNCLSLWGIAGCIAQHRPSTTSDNLDSTNSQKTITLNNQTMTEKININRPISFAPPQNIGAISLEYINYEVIDSQWTSFKMVLKTACLTNSILEQNAFFNNFPENRIETVEGGFNETIPVWIELSLEPTNFHLLPATNTNLLSYFQNIESTSNLLQENIWNMLTAWQEHHLDPSIGGGVIKVGYRTKFSNPSNKIDALKRQGVVSNAIVTALIEGGLPVHFNEKEALFEVQLSAKEEKYTAFLKPDNQSIALGITLISHHDIPEDSIASAIESTNKINKEITLGTFSIPQQQVTYFHYMNVSAELVSPKWVTEMLLAGVSLIHHYAPEITKVAVEKD